MREYSIPHLRRAGRISIPEDSFDRIREARDLHKMGLGTESVRRQLREGTGELDSTLDRLHQTLESLREDIRGRPVVADVTPSPALRTILARQSLIMSALINLTERVEDLLPASRKPRKPVFEDLEPLPERQGRDPLATQSVTAPARGSVGQPPALRSTDFGTLGRRRRGVLAILVAALLVACVAWATLAQIGAGNAGSSVPRVTNTADEPLDAPKAVAAPGGSGSEAETKVPGVSGRSLEEAVRIISGAGFEVASIKTQASPRDPGTAIRTQPAAGVRAKPRAPVTLTMSGGPTGAASSAR
ncbi:MAG: PASTA domain-containing protein, partial [Actinomycetota bacterium]|nr:PASTA domain-containing protein [Actinomycetota bacterium]